MEESVAGVEEARFVVAGVGAVADFAGGAGGADALEVTIHRAPIAVGVIAVAFLHGAGGVDTGGDVEVVVQAIPAFFHDAVAVAVAVAQDQVVGVSHAPDELPFSSRTCVQPLLQVLPLVGVIIMVSVGGDFGNAPVHAVIRI